ncbi:NAD(P)/FAD-dependent oxidoreductase [Muriicola soli]|uniref:FAD-binding oxidoreductase n=1 Tax=Muriicola soli TaxID=2507538 RepID=A0A411EBD5_9FLAO|nr:FAD-binding oxidoreductase [Muriicola soli]QBA64979.1 FAD-binding oxidoreductase [Muriicola soli]
MVDYLVVGLGLAGISFCETLEQGGKSFIVVSDKSQKASTVAGGLYNPVTLKRFTLSWKAHEQLALLPQFYAGLEEKLGVQLDHPLRVLRRFTSIAEQNQWFEASDKPGLEPLMSTSLIPNTNAAIEAQHSYGEVLRTGRVDTKLLQRSYRNYLLDRNLLREESFEFNSLAFREDHLLYKNIKAKHLVFALGFGLKQNPYFNCLPLIGSKGEYLMIKAPDLKETHIIKSPVFLIPQGNHIYRVGATYKREDKTNKPTTEAREELEVKLKSFLKCDYEVVDQLAGIRPTTGDRRPLVGQHPHFPSLYILNGFGSRGVMIAPYASKALYNYIENQAELPAEMDIKRFKKRFGRG